MVMDSKLAIRVSKKTSNSQDIVYYMYTTFFVQDYAFEPRFLDIAMCYTDCGNNVKVFTFTRLHDLLLYSPVASRF